MRSVFSDLEGHGGHGWREEKRFFKIWRGGLGHTDGEKQFFRFGGGHGGAWLMRILLSELAGGGGAWLVRNSFFRTLRGHQIWGDMGGTWLVRSSFVFHFV